MCYWFKFQEDEKNKILREVPVHANTEIEAMNRFQQDFPNIGRFELVQF